LRGQPVKMVEQWSGTLGHAQAIRIDQSSRLLEGRADPEVMARRWDIRPRSISRYHTVLPITMYLVAARGDGCVPPKREKV
jgi:hypothetical protein